ncbi:NAD(P)H-dependent oxidoreductase [Methylocapsa polymorpha]|uniref:NAD(P)H-dependent oxidoreductase n=1 Tax=Methylocapsa polymorpha TaxID=3080828 RepID=A0ABZ0HY14_9HYPH|nr:NAD(P)H-dependent oxidoreductase [Methylocapsa sp. RX1]
MPLDFVILYGSVRTERQGIRVARFIESEIRARGHTTALIDPMVYRLPLLDRMYKEYAGDAPAPLEQLANFYRKTDGFVIVSGEYNHGIPPALKNLLDHFLEEYFWRPSAIVSYSAGNYGGVRVAMQLRMTLSELGMPSIPSILSFGRVSSAFSETGEPHDPPAAAAPTGRFLNELEWYARAFQAERAKGTPY